MNKLNLHQTLRPGLLVALLACALAGCTQLPQEAMPLEPPKPKLQFVDLQGFDRELNASLAAPLPAVDVAFLDRVVPSALPVRLQSWMAAVESGGGKVNVVPAPSSVSAKSPLLLIGAITSLWTASKMAMELSSKQQFVAAKGYDANILLKVDEHGDSVVDKVVFVQRKK